jgi:tRNA(Ile)-lysidine synthase TilS/MesJ
MKDVCESRYTQEMSKQQYQDLTHQMNFYDTPSNLTFECSPLKCTTKMLEMIENTDLRQQLLRQFKTSAEQARNDLFQFRIKYVEEEANEYSSKHEEIMRRMSSIHDQTIDAAQSISSVLVQIILQRSEKISERIQCIYRYQAQSTFSS